MASPKGPKISVPSPVAKQPGTPFARDVKGFPTVTEGDPYEDRRGTINTRKTRGQFRTIEFQRAILQHGYWLMWRKAAICPCLNKTTKQAAINCSHCDGSGFFYFDPIEIRGIMTRFERNTKAFEKFGAWVEGTSQLTVEPQYRMGYQDHVEMLDSIMTHSEVITKGDRRGARFRLPDNVDAARYRISRLVQAVVLDENDNSIKKLDYSQLTITEEGWLRWEYEGQQMVADGTYVSLIYEYHPILVVVSHLHALRDGVLESKSPTATVHALPVQTTVKLDYLLDTIGAPPSMQTGPLPRYGQREEC